MSMIAGLVDVTSWLTLGGVFTAHITGNIVIVAAGLVRRGHPSAAQTLAVPMFVLAVVIADLTTRRLSDSCRSRTLVLLLLQSALLFSTFLLSVQRSHGASADGNAAFVETMLAVSAMATQNALLHLTQEKVQSTAVMTGNLVQATISALELLRPSSHSAGKANWNASFPLLMCFFFGCIMGAALVKFVALWAWLAPAAISLLYVLWFSVKGHATDTQTNEWPI